MTLQPNANWQTSNDAATKDPVYAVSLDGGTVWYYRGEIASGAGANHYKYLSNVSGISSRFDPIRGESSRSGFNFELLTSSGVWNFDELYGTKVLVKVGYNDLAWSDFIQIQVSYIYEISFNKEHTGFVFKCQDIQKETDIDIFTGATVGSPVTISARNPITFALQIMISDGGGGGYDVLGSGNGCGIDSTLIDVTECELFRGDFISSWQGAWSITEPQNAYDFLRDEIFIPFGITPIVKADGTFSMVPFLPAFFGYLAANNRADVLTDAKITELPGWHTNYRDVKNRIIYNYDFNTGTGEYDSSATYNDTTSQGLYGIKPLTIDSKGITTALDGANLTQTIATRYFRKFAVLPQIITIKTKFSERVIESGDQLLITSDHIPNIDTSNTVWSSRVADVWQAKPNFKEGVMEFELRDNNVGALKYGVISPAATVDYGSATALQKAKYCWVDENYAMI